MRVLTVAFDTALTCAIVTIYSRRCAVASGLKVSHERDSHLVWSAACTIRHFVDLPSAQNESKECRARINKNVSVLRVDHISINSLLPGMWQIASRTLDTSEPPALPAAPSSASFLGPRYAAHSMGHPHGQPGETSPRPARTDENSPPFQRRESVMNRD